MPRSPRVISGAVRAAAGCAGEDGAVVGQYRGGCAPSGEGGGEGVDDVGAADTAPREAGDRQSGVVVEDVEDFHAAAVGEVPVGDVGLPAVVGQLGAEAFPG
jgi:hypothetical protein